MLMTAKYDLLSKVKITVARTLADKKAIGWRQQPAIECNSNGMNLSNISTYDRSLASEQVEWHNSDQ